MVTIALVKDHGGTGNTHSVSPVRQHLRKCNMFQIWITNTKTQISINLKNKCDHVYAPNTMNRVPSY